MALYKVTILLAFIVFYAPYPSSVPVSVSHFALQSQLFLTQFFQYGSPLFLLFRSFIIHQTINHIVILFFCDFRTSQILPIFLCFWIYGFTMGLLTFLFSSLCTAPTQALKRS